MADDIKKEEKKAEKNAEVEAKLGNVPSKEEAGVSPDEKAETAAQAEEAAGTSSITPAEVEAINTDDETAKEANGPVAKPKPSGKFKDLIKEIEGLTTLELAELVKALEERFGVTATAPVAMAANSSATSDAQEAEEKLSYTLVLADSGTQKIAVIKALREINQELGLKEAKDLADGAPKEIKKDMPKDEAEVAKKKLEAAGAKVELK